MGRAASVYLLSIRCREQGTAALTEQIAQVEREAKRMSAWRGCMGWGWKSKSKYA